MKYSSLTRTDTRFARTQRDLLKLANLSLTPNFTYTR